MLGEHYRRCRIAEVAAESFGDRSVRSGNRTLEAQPKA